MTNPTMSRKDTIMATATQSQSTQRPEYLETLIPPAEVADQYIDRYVDGILALDTLAYAQKHGKHVLLAGPTGAGKTMLVRAYAAKTNQPFVNVTGDGSLQPEDLFGQLYGDVETGGLRWVNGPVLDVVVNGGILNLDEVNFLRGKVTASTHGLFDGRRVLTLLKHPFKYFDPKGQKYYAAKADAPAKTKLISVDGPAYIPAHPDLLVVGSYNPDYADTSPINEAFANRFAVKMNWGYDEGVESTLVFGQTLKAVASQLRGMKRGGEIRTDVSTNLLMEFEEMALDEDLTFAFARTMFINHFAPAEQSAVAQTFDLHRTELMAEYGWEDISEEAPSH